MDAKFDWRSGGAVYLGLVSLEYVVIGLFGVFSRYSPGPFFLSLFLTASPYPLLQYMKNCTFGLTCGISAMQFDFTATNPSSRNFAVLSVALVVTGLAGLAAVCERGATGRRILLILCSLGTLVSVANCIESFAAVYLGIVPFSSFPFLELTISCVWSFSYWIGLSQVKGPLVFQSIRHMPDDPG